MLMKISELSGTALDWAVAKCEGYPVSLSKTGFLIFSDPLIQCGPRGSVYAPSTNWSQGGPIIEREEITTSKEDGCWSAYFRDRLFEEDGSEHWSVGETPLSAAMRCYVASHLGGEIEIPDELI